MRFARLAVLTIGLGIAGPVAAQDPQFLSRLDDETAGIVAPILEAASRDSLPVRALESKVLEGVVKNVPPGRIGQAVAELATELRGARAGLRERLPSATFTDGEVVAAARAVRQGVSVDWLDDLWDARPDDRPLDVPVTVLSELVRRGIPVEEAADLMSHVVRTSVPLHLAAQIPGKVDVALGTAGSPVDALTQALRVLDIPPPGRRPGG